MPAGYKLVTYASPKEAARRASWSARRVHDAAALTGNAADATVLGILRGLGRPPTARLQGGAPPKARQRPAACRFRACEAPRAGALPGQRKSTAPARTTPTTWPRWRRAQGKEPGPTMKDLGEKPWHFVKTSRSSVVGARREGEAARVLAEGRLGSRAGPRSSAGPRRDVPVDKALACVAGWTIAQRPVGARHHPAA